ncbi:hypothetical protein ACFYZ3_38360 [Streptomyces sp. NPDC001599]|uniref:hypothetical protein n=1 Tax=Streptomyces sp. NPDC001599 TaxID=3364591 RepID=UPI0036939AA2
MTGAGESWLRDGLDGVAGVESVLWVRGVDYVGGWRSARESADRLNRALLGAGFELSAVRAVASADESGRGVVRVTGWPETADRLAALLEALTDHDGCAW